MAFSGERYIVLTRSRNVLSFVLLLEFFNDGNIVVHRWDKQIQEFFFFFFSLPLSLFFSLSLNTKGDDNIKFVNSIVALELPSTQRDVFQGMM